MPGGVEPAEQAVEEVQPAGAVAAVLVRGERRPGGRWSARVIRSAATKLTRSGSCPEWVAAWAIRERIA